MPGRPRQASDHVIWSIVRRQNSKARAYANQKTLPYFTRESGNLLQRQTFRHSGYRRRYVGVGQRRAKKHQGEQFTLVMARRGRSRKPRKSVSRCVVHAGNKAKLQKSIRRQLNMRLYRPELSTLALKRMLKVRDARKQYKYNLRRENRNRPVRTKQQTTKPTTEAPVTEQNAPMVDID